MLIGLHDADIEHIKGKSFPNYALMKISAWHKQCGDAVKLFTPINPNECEQLSFFPTEEYPLRRKAEIYDIVYSSKIFDFTPENPYLPEGAIKGGTGYNVKIKLPKNIDDIYPDYSIYPHCDYAIGYITRGCPNKCRWCVVPEKEGGIKPYRTWRELIRADSDKLVLMDNNILASDYGISQLESLIDSKIKIDLNQGMDARLVTNDIANVISRLEWIRHIRFSCDTTAQIDAIAAAASYLKKYGVKPYRLFVYLLVTADVANAAYRVERLREIGGIRIYAQAERNPKQGIMPNALQLEFSQRYVYSGKYKTETWLDYCARHKITEDKT